MSVCFLNGEFLPVEDARISVMDRGFIFGDGVYEVLPVYSGRIFRLQAHLERLEASLAAIGIAHAKPAQGWSQVLEDLVERSGYEDCSLYLQVTRGCAPRAHAPTQAMQPTLFAQCQPHEYRTPKVVHAILAEDFRWTRCDIKSTSLLGSVMLKMQAQESNADEAILHRDEWVTEGSVSNVFVVNANVVSTPPVSNQLLAGITRSFVIEICEALGLTVKQEPVRVADLFDAQEIWVSSSTRELAPVVSVDQQRIGTGDAGGQWQRVYEIYRRRVRED